MKTSADKEAERVIQKRLAELGGSEAVRRFANGYGKRKTLRHYLTCLSTYFRWQRDNKGVAMSPDELIKDNLVCIFDSAATDVSTKRRHTDWLSEFVNGYMVQRGLKDGSREVYAAAVKEFYRRNDSPRLG